jgi:hypothetical protein
VKEQRLAFEAPASSSASPAFCAPGRPGAHSLLFSQYHQHQHQRRRQHQHPPGPPPVHIGAPLHVVCPVTFCPASRRFLLSHRGLSLDRACSYGVTRGLWASGRILSRSCPASCTRVGNVFFFVPTRGLFSLPFSLSLSSLLPLFLFRRHLSLSLSHLHCPGPARLVWLCRSGGRTKCERRIRT